MVTQDALQVITTIAESVGALATAAAVIVALWLARRESRVRLSITNGIYHVIAVGQTMQNSPQVIHVRATNEGFRSLKIAGVTWQLGQWRKKRFVVALPGAGANSTKLPARLEYGDDASFYFPLQTFPGDAKVVLDAIKASKSPRRALKKLRVGVYTTTGHEITSPIDSTLRDWLSKHLGL